MAVEIFTEELRKEFGTLAAVADANLAVHRGETFGLLGRNGAGKSTLIRLLTTLLEPTSGRAVVAGCNVRTEADAVRRQIGVIPQAMTSDPEMTAEENLDFYGKLYGVPKAVRVERTGELLEGVKLLEWRDKRVGTFSGGMRRRLEIARGLMHRPRVLFLDEPTTGLDPASRIAMWELIGRLKVQAGITVFLTTHYMEEADQLCDRVAIFDHGRVVALDTPAALKARLTGGETIEMRIAPDDPRWAGLLAALPGVRAVRREGASWRMSTVDRVPTLEALLGRARQAGVAITSLTVRGSSLDDVFINFTGESTQHGIDAPPASVPVFPAGRAS